jgi:hypothetical protein
MIKLLTSLTRQPAENCIILTYNADLLFFEYMVFDPLYAAGCHNVLVMCDPAQYQLALRDTSQLRHAGQRYPILPARTSPAGAFHPKLMLLTSAEGGRLFLTSGNLTKAGYTTNWEVASLFEYTTKKPDLTALRVCQWAFDTLSTITSASDSSGLARKSLDQLWSTTGWLRQERSGSGASRVWPLHNVARPLLSQVLEQYRRDDGSPIREAVVVSPFFDTGAYAIDRLLDELQPQQLTLLTQGRPSGLNPHALKEVLARHASAFQATDLALSGRRLHAKALVLRTERGVWVASGSANFTAPAWLRRAEAGNTEMVVLRYETDPAHFDAWLDELAVDSQPLNLDWEPTPINQSVSAVDASLTLLDASVEGKYLVLRLAEQLPRQSSLTVRLGSTESQEIGADQWSQTDDNNVRVALTQEIMVQLERPTLVTIEVMTLSGRLWSNPMLVHHLRALSRASQPLRRRDRPRIPEGMEPESYEHCAQILDMLTNLLASNTEQLNRHRGRAVAYAREERLERQMELEEGYNPEDHFVEERVRVVATLSGGDLYADYDDRMTYEELLRAVLAAVYQPQRSIDAMAGNPMEDVVSLPGEPRPLPTNEALRVQLLGRIERGFQRLIENFDRGTNDLEYMASVPPRYLIELFAILLTFLRTTRRHGMLSDQAFTELSWALLAAFWGDVGQPGAMQSLCERLTTLEMNTEDTRLALSAQTWFHATMVADILSHTKERGIYDFAAWARNMRVVFRGFEVLADLDTAAYQRLWQSAYPPERALCSARELVVQLQKLAETYDEESLCREIEARPGARARTSLGEIAKLRQVPKLDVRMPLDDGDLDQCLRTFVLFLEWPQPKDYAWARFTNTNPAVNSDDLESVTIFYYADRPFSFAAKRAGGGLRPDVEKPLTLSALRAIQSIGDL